MSARRDSVLKDPVNYSEACPPAWVGTGLVNQRNPPPLFFASTQSTLQKVQVLAVLGGFTFLFPLTPAGPNISTFARVCVSY